MAKFAVTDLSASMTIVAGLLLPVTSPVQFTKLYPVSADACKLTVSP
ncbi:hypothetical protein ES703_61340 [subsurface metagenome]